MDNINKQSKQPGGRDKQVAEESGVYAAEVGSWDGAFRVQDRGRERGHKENINRTAKQSRQAKIMLIKNQHKENMGVYAFILAALIFIILAFIL